MKLVNIGIIGAGRIGCIHAQNLSQMPGVQLKAISDVRVDHMEQQAAQWGVSVLMTDNDAVFADSDIDAVMICSSTDSHVDLIKKAVAHGKHVFCEKPISLNVESTRKTVETVQNAGVLFQTGFNRRFDPHFRRLKESVAAGAIGTPHIVKITSRDPGPPSYDYIAKSGGMFIDMTIHDFDMARYLSGSDVEQVYVQGGVFVDPVIGQLGDIDTAVISLRFANGMLGMIDNSRKAVYGYDQRVEVFGSKGSVAALNESMSNVVWSTEEGVVCDKPKHFFLERYVESYKTEAAAFVEAIRTGERAPVDEHDGLQAELIAYAAKRSQEEGRPVRLSEF